MQHHRCLKKYKADNAYRHSTMEATLNIDTRKTKLKLSLGMEQEKYICTYFMLTGSVHKLSWQVHYIQMMNVAITIVPNSARLRHQSLSNIFFLHITIRAHHALCATAMSRAYKYMLAAMHYMQILFHVLPVNMQQWCKSCYK